MWREGGAQRGDEGELTRRTKRGNNQREIERKAKGQEEGSSAERKGGGRLLMKEVAANV